MSFHGPHVPATENSVGIRNACRYIGVRIVRARLCTHPPHICTHESTQHTHTRTHGTQNTHKHARKSTHTYGQARASTQNHAQARASTHRYAQARTNAYNHNQSCTNTHKHAQAGTHTHIWTQARTSTFKHAQARTCTHKHTNKAHPSTYIHAQACTSTHKQTKQTITSTHKHAQARISTHKYAYARKNTHEYAWARTSSNEHAQTRRYFLSRVYVLCMHHYYNDDEVKREPSHSVPWHWTVLISGPGHGRALYGRVVCPSGYVAALQYRRCCFCPIPHFTEQLVVSNHRPHVPTAAIFVIGIILWETHMHVHSYRRTHTSQVQKYAV